MLGMPLNSETEAVILKLYSFNKPVVACCAYREAFSYGFNRLVVHTVDFYFFAFYRFIEL